MHLIYAWLFSVKTGGFSGNFTQTDVMPVAHFYAKKSCSAQGGIFHGCHPPKLRQA
ncbi:hypothetical protein EC1094_3516 [Escherichia coli]|nr:hypothetical protein EC1094_3516 [Escherichia coli]SMZ46675.1 hypothetical protein EC1094V2_3580 [Escherichia coli]